jgi:23S rRNA pseudouridine2604 synthase
MTSNGDIVNKIPRAGNQHEKEYIVMVDKPIKDDFIDTMQRMGCLGVMTQKCSRKGTPGYFLPATPGAGMNRQIRRKRSYFRPRSGACSCRIRITNISIKGSGALARRELRDKELKVLFEMHETQWHRRPRRRSGIQPSRGDQPSKPPAAPPPARHRAPTPRWATRPRKTRPCQPALGSGQRPVRPEPSPSVAGGSAGHQPPAWAAPT